MTLTFARLPKAERDRPSGVTAAIVGISEASPYKLGIPSHSANAPAALRAASDGFAGQLCQFDFDLGRPLFGEQGETFGMVDCGDIPGPAPPIPQAIATVCTGGPGSILDAGAVPVVLGGDDPYLSPFCRAWARDGRPFTVLHIDAPAADWGDVIQSNPVGYGGAPCGAPLEMPWITGMVQIGMRGLGSGDAWQIRDAKAWGSRLVESRSLHAEGSGRGAARYCRGKHCSAHQHRLRRPGPGCPASRKYADTRRSPLTKT